MTYDFSVGIVNWNTAELVCSAIQSIYDLAGSYQIQVLVADNNSSDDSVHQIRTRFPQVHLEANQENIGFARAHNQLWQHSKAPIHIIDEASMNIVKMRSAARRLKNEYGLDMLIVDYLQLMSPTLTKGSDSMVQQITEISRSLKILAKEMEIHVIALSQLSRAVEQRGGKPRLSDLRDSGSIEQDADVVMFIHREDKMNKDKEPERPNIAEILVEKHRNGAVGAAELYFDGQHVRFLNLDTHHAAAGGGHGGGDDF